MTHTPEHTRTFASPLIVFIWKEYDDEGANPMDHYAGAAKNVDELNALLDPHRRDKIYLKGSRKFQFAQLQGSDLVVVGSFTTCWGSGSLGYFTGEGYDFHKCSSERMLEMILERAQ